jgi:hypothetical protein
MGTEVDLYIFYKEKRNRTQDQATNIDKSLTPVTINKVIPYRDLEKVRQSYGVNDQDPYFFIQERLLPDIVIH